MLYSFGLRLIYTSSYFSWVVIPLWLMYDSYGHIAGALRFAQKAQKDVKKA